jgi:hypothetical protein
MRPAMSGAARRASAMFVSGPTGTSQRPSTVRHCSTMNATASVPSSGVVGSGSSAPVEAGLAVDVLAELRLGDQRPFAAGVDGDVDGEQVAHDPGVVGRALERGVAGHRGDADEFGVAGSGDDRHRVVVPRIAVEQHPRSFGHRPDHASRASCV